MEKSLGRQTSSKGVLVCYFPAPFLLPSDYGIPCKLLPTDDTMWEMEIDLPKVVHGPLLISFADLNGFEFGTKIRNPNQKLFERTPDDVIANGVAVFYGDFSLPEAAALKYEHRACELLEYDPTAALLAAQQAVALVPDSFDGNLKLGDALMSTGNTSQTRAAYAVAAGRINEMEPSSQEHWRPVIMQKEASAERK